MQILFDSSIFFHQKHGGISRYFLNIYKEFVHRKINTKILAPIHSNTFLKDSSCKSKLNFYVTRYPKNTRKLFKFYNQTITDLYLKIYKPDILHKTFYEKNLNKNKKVKKVLTVMDLAHEIYYKDYGFNENFRHKKLSIQNLDHIICSSNQTKKDFLNYYDFPEKRIDVVYMGAEQFINCKIVELNEIDGPFLLYVGQRGKYKNFINLLKAYNLSKNLKKDFKLVCFGGGKFTREEHELFKKENLNTNNLFQLDGDDNKLLSLYRGASAFIYPSIIEGLGLPPLEAMLQGCPVIASNHPAILEAVDVAAETFDPFDLEDIKKKIEKVLYDESYKETLIKNGFKQSKLFTWNKCASETLDVYNKIQIK